MNLINRSETLKKSIIHDVLMNEKEDRQDRHRPIKDLETLIKYYENTKHFFKYEVFINVDADLSFEDKNEVLKEFSNWLNDKDYPYISDYQNWFFTAFFINEDHAAEFKLAFG